MEKDLSDLLDNNIRQLQEDCPAVFREFVEELMLRNRNDLRPLQTFMGCLVGCLTYGFWLNGVGLDVGYEPLEELLNQWREEDSEIMRTRLAVLYEKAGVNLHERSDHDPGYYPPSAMN